MDDKNERLYKYERETIVEIATMMEVYGQIPQGKIDQLIKENKTNTEMKTILRKITNGLFVPSDFLIP